MLGEEALSNMSAVQETEPDREGQARHSIGGERSGHDVDELALHEELSLFIIAIKYFI